MVRLSLSRNLIDIEHFMDVLIEEPFVEVDDVLFSRKAGIYLKPLLRCDPPLLESYHSDVLKKTVFILRSKQVKKIIGPGNMNVYLFDHVILKMPKI